MENKAEEPTATATVATIEIATAATATASTAVREMHLNFLLHTSRRQITASSSAARFVRLCVRAYVRVCLPMSAEQHF